MSPRNTGERGRGGVGDWNVPNQQEGKIRWHQQHLLVISVSSGIPSTPALFPSNPLFILRAAPMAGISTSHLLLDALRNRERTETTIDKKVPSFTDCHAKSSLLSSPGGWTEPLRNLELLPFWSFTTKLEILAFYMFPSSILLPFLPGPPSLGVL